MLQLFLNKLWYHLDAFYRKFEQDQITCTFKNMEKARDSRRLEHLMKKTYPNIAVIWTFLVPLCSFHWFFYLQGKITKLFEKFVVNGQKWENVWKNWVWPPEGYFFDLGWLLLHSFGATIKKPEMFSLAKTVLNGVVTEVHNNVAQ